GALRQSALEFAPAARGARRNFSMTTESKVQVSIVKSGPKAVFPRIARLPPYVFNVIGDLKKAARARGEDIIDFGMGNPDQPTPRHIVDKMVEVVQREGTTHAHRYSVSKGIPRLRRAMANWYKNRYDVKLDADSEVIAAIGSK